jgi:hypothetical protein
VLAVLDVDAVLPDVPDRDVRRAELVGSVPVERVLVKLWADRFRIDTPSAMDDDAVLAPVGAVEDDRVAVDPLDRQIAFRLRDDDAAGVRSGGEDDLVTAATPRATACWSVGASSGTRISAPEARGLALRPERGATPARAERSR